MPAHVDSSTRRIIIRAVLLVVPIVGLAAAAPWAVGQFRGGSRGAEGPRPDRPATRGEIWASRRADEKLADAEKAWERSTAIAARDAVVDAAGERVRWFQGFGVSVESTPAGASVLVNGQELGETPLTTSVQCKPGETVRVEVRKDGHRPQKRTTRCREDQLVEMVVELR